MESRDFINGYKAFTPSGEIASLTLSLMGPQEVKALSHVEVITGEAFHQGRPVDRGIYDDHMGTTMESIYCSTCWNGNDWCPGHHGSYSLVTPVPNPLPMAFILRWLKILCWTCGRLLSRNIPSGKLDPQRLLAFYIKYSKKIEECPWCKADVWVAKQKKPDYPLAYAKIKASSIRKHQKTSSHSLDGYEPLYYTEIHDIFRRVTDRTVVQAGMPVKSHPSKLLISELIVTATSIRPEIKSPDKKMRSNDITSLLKVIVDQNEGIPRPLPDPEQITEKIEMRLYLLALAVRTLIKGSDATSVSKEVQLFSNTKRDFTGLGSRLPKKFGQWRRELFGKRAHKIFRSVITGDNNIPVGWVGVPVETARTIQIFETVQDYNYPIMVKTFKNGTGKYPGCSMIIRSDTGSISGIEGVPHGYKLRFGDILLRDLIDGDYINYNRQPTLSFSSIAGYRVVVLQEGNTLRMNVSACKWHNADFDGDCMIGIVAQDIQPIIEIQYMSSARNFVVSYKDGIPIIGAYQDSLINFAMMSSAHNPAVIRSKAMKLFANVDQLGVGNPLGTWDFGSQEFWTTRELITKILPAINISTVPKFYNSKFVPYMKYHPDDIRVEIINGKHVSGMLDAETTGPGAKNGIIHVIHNEYGPEMALKFIYAVNQLTTQYHLFNGFSVSAKDIHSSPATREVIANNVSKIIAQSRDITERLFDHKLKPPTGVSMRAFYEEQQFNILQPGDGFLYPALRDVDLYDNGIVLLMLTGSKGKIASQFISLTGMVGMQDVAGAMPIADVGVSRTSPYFNNFDTDPQSMGFVTQPFFDGIDGRVYLYAAQETRNGLITLALSTALAGAANRSAIKNFENQKLDPLRQCIKMDNIIQPLYGGTGFDPRKIETVKFLTVSCSGEKFTSDFKTLPEHIPTIYRNAGVQKLLDSEFEQLAVDRKEFRRVFLTVEQESVVKLVRFSDKRELPINIERIIKNVLYAAGDIKSDAANLNPGEAVQTVSGFCDVIAYLYTNQKWEDQKKYIPSHFEQATLASQMAIRAYLCTRELIRRGISNAQLDLIISQIRVTFKKAFMDYGMAVGILAAQCVSEPFTQFVLDSKHRSGAGGGTKTSAIVRVSEILEAKSTKNMRNPMMRIFVDTALERDENVVRTMANHIEMVSVEDVIAEVQIFYEKAGQAVHPRFKHENVWVNAFKQHTSQRAKNLINYCIRLEFNREKLMLKSLSFHTIVTTLQREFPSIYMVYTAENESRVILRLYPTYGSLKKQSSKTLFDQMLEIMKNIRLHIIRGIDGIRSANVMQLLRTRIDPETDAILPDLGRIYVIDTDGSNLEEILDYPGVDASRTQTDSIVEMAKVYGIECARAKIISELSVLLPSTHMCHLSIYADEMVSTGIITNIERSGTAKRDRTNITQRASFGAPLQVLTEAAVYNYTDQNMTGVSGSLAMGTVPKIGTLYHDVVIDQEFIEKFSRQATNDLDEI